MAEGAAASPAPAAERPLRSVAIVMLTAVGDVVHVLPVVNSLRAAHPDVRITWIVQPGPGGLVAGHPAVDEFILFDRRQGWRAFRDLRRAVRGRRFDLVLALQDYLKAGVIAALLPADRKLGLDRARARDLNWLFTTERVAPRPPRHTQEQYLEFLEHLGIPVRLDWTGLGPTPAEAERYAPLLPPHPGPTVALVIGTSKPAKEWPVERYAELVDRLHEETGARAILVGGRSLREAEAAERIAAIAAHPPLDLREWDLRRVAFLLDRADVVVSPDTGPLHIAVALGTPSVALMGYTNPKRVGPIRFRDLLVDAFGDPGEEYGPEAGRREGRMDRIEVEMVLEKVELALRRYPKERSAGQSGP
ncbi:MAG TPA: glycosyltransferase family 9 protein [Longimicrobium sp.]|nr:glycosyltransferase family 9 protein [Longimicrobium sp.]